MLCFVLTLASKDLLVQWKRECRGGVQGRSARKECREGAQIVASTVQTCSAGVKSRAEQFSASVQSAGVYWQQLCYTDSDSVSVDLI